MNTNKINNNSEDNLLITNIHDFIPPKYERFSQNELIIKYLTFIILAIDGLIFFGTIQNYIFNFNNTLSIINFVCIIIFFILDVAWLHYKLQHVIMGIYKLFMDLKIFKINSKYYSGLEIPDIFINNKSYPDITIQLPVYKEDLENTIKPTILSAICEALRYYSETGSICNIIVCDDGYNLISNAEKEKRREFYIQYNIGFTARPHPNKYKRNGRFKKAGNLNFSMNYSAIAIYIYHLLNVNEAESEEEQKAKEGQNEIGCQNEKNEIEEQKDKKVEEINNFYELLRLGAVFQGNLYYGPYIFLIDSDTRLPSFPENENGCFKRLIKDMLFDGENNVLYMQCFTSPYISTKSLSEKCVFHSTCNIYNGILVGTSMNAMAPLVGHNALLNVRILDEIAQVNEVTKYKYYWDENRISEDFDCMMRGCDKGYIGRYVASCGIFYEGVSFNYMTEYFKLSKFACGAAELTFNPIDKWFKKGGGVFSPDIIAFIYCKEIEWYNKIGILTYILNFIAIAQSNVAMFYNLFFFEQLFAVLPFILLPVNLMWESMFVWCVINTAINVLFSFRIKFEPYVVFRQQIRETFFTSSLYGSLSVRFLIMYLTHLLNLKISFGATQKNHEKVTFCDWISSTKYEFIIYTFYLICICIRLFLFPVRSTFHTFYFGCLPLFMNIFWYWFGPIIYDILPNKTDKTKTDKYRVDEKMFHDKYLTQIPNSYLFFKNSKDKNKYSKDNKDNSKKNDGICVHFDVSMNVC